MNSIRIGGIVKEIDIIIVNHNSTDCTVKAIESLKEKINGIIPNIVVVDNASNDKPQRILDRFPGIRLFLNNENLGFSKAVNVALRGCSARYLAILNPDTIVLNDFFEETLEYLEKHKEVGVLGPKIFDADGSVQGSARRFPTLWSYAFGRKSPLTRIFPNNPKTKKEFMCFDCDDAEPVFVDWISGACMVVRRSVMDAVGGFDERFFLYWEDTDLCKRIKESGSSVVYYPKAEITHLVGMSSQKNPIKSIWHFHHSCYKLLAKHAGSAVKLLAPIVIFGLSVRCLFVMAVNMYGSGFSSRHGKTEFDSTKKKRVLILNQYYPPDQSATAGILYKIVQYIHHCHHVILLTGRPSYQTPIHYGWRFIRQEKSKNLHIMRLGTTALPRNRMIKRILNYLSYLAFALPLSLIVKFDTVVCMTDPPLIGMIGAIAAKVRRRKFIYYIQDLHPDMALASNLIKRGLLYRIWEKLHLWVLNAADRVIVIGDDMKKCVIAKGVDKHKVVVIRNVFGSPSSDQSIIKDKIIQEVRDGFDLIVIHAGNIGHYGDWATPIKAAALLEKKSIGFVFIGEGAEKDKLTKRTTSLNNVKVMPYFPEKDLPSVYSAGDLYMINMKKGLEGLVVPSKMYPILSSGKPVLAIAAAGSEVSKIVKAYECGIALEPNDPGRLATELSVLLDSPARLSEMGKNASKAYDDIVLENPLELFSKEFI